MLIESVTIDSNVFHTASFTPQSLAAGGHLSIQVIFLPRAVAQSQASLVISTSHGLVRVQVRRVRLRGVAARRLGLPPGGCHGLWLSCRRRRRRRCCCR